MNADLLAVSGWFSCNGLAVNSDKCLSMWLGNTMANSSYRLDSYEISSVDTIKLLGVTIDRQLNFNDHVAAIVRKIRNSLIPSLRSSYTMLISYHSLVTVVGSATPLN